MSKHKFPYEWNLSDGYPAKGIDYHGSKVFSCFACGGGSTMGYKLAGYEVLGMNEIDPKMAKAYIANHNPKYSFIEDIREFKVRKDIPKELYDLDILDGSPPCFVGGTLVMTNKGFKEIQNLVIGDFVLTHENRFKRVTSVMSKDVESLYSLKIQGSTHLGVTGEHPFYTKRMNRRNKYGNRSFSEPIWKDVKDLSIVKNTSNTILEQDYIGVAINQESIIPEGKLFDSNNDFNAEDVNFWYLIGRWFGDGWTRVFKSDKANRVQPKYQSEQMDCQNCGEPSRRHSRYENQWTAYCSEKCRKQYGRKKRKPSRNEFIICCGKHELEYLVDKFKLVTDRFIVSEQKNTYRITISSKLLCGFIAQFSKGAKDKRLTDDVLNLPIEQLTYFLDGYLDADGHYDKKRDKYSCTSISKQLIYGIQHCIHKVYKVPTSVSIKDNSKYSSVIEGREVKTNVAYSLGFFKTDKPKQHGFYENGYLWIPFRGKEELKTKETVYNISVEDDESYTVNNLICHNCSSFSMAGNRDKDWGKKKVFREGQANQVLDDLVFEYINTIKKLKPKVALLENVKGLIQGNAKAYAKKINKQFKKAGYRVQLFLLNAASMGVPQKRERVFFIGLRNDFDLPKLVLDFNEEGVVFGNARKGLTKNGKKEWITLTDFQETLWNKCSQGENFAKHNNGSGFSDFKSSDSLVFCTLTAQQHKFYHSTEPRHLYQSEFCAIGSYPQDYNFLDLKYGYLIGMSVPPVMTAQISHQIYLQWLSKIKL